MSKPAAVILAAGRGTRLQQVTRDLPKPLLALHGRPLVEHVLGSLREAGFGRFLLVVGYRHELFYARFAGDPSIHFALQDPVDGTGSAARLARPFTRDEPFLLIFGDILAAPEDIRAVWQRLAADPQAAAVVAVKEVDDPWQGAAVYEAGGVVTEIIEKPPFGTSRTRWNSAGIFAFRPAVYDALARIEKSPRGEYELSDGLRGLLAAGQRVLAQPLEHGWRDVGRPEDIAAALELTTGRLRG
ncbi:MAG: nucleotidyltransferase family protein [Bryobacteraceae bacterium]|nr:nucleotidyltransferase family protein [Bryobacteraceae bacterium]